MENTLIFLQKLLDITTHIPMSVIPLEEKAFIAFFQNNADCIHHWEQLQSTKSNTVCQCSLPDGSFLLLYPLRARKIILLFGPAADLHMLCQVGDLIVRHMTEPTSPAEPPSFHRNGFLGEDISQMRQVEQRYEYSAALTNAVQQGNLSLALHMISQYDPGTKTAVRNTNPLRNAQNYCIVLNTQLRHALEKSGIHPYQVDRLSNEIGLEIEQLKNISQIPAFFSGVIRRYCRLVQEHAYPNLKPLTNLAVTYIKEHLADNLTVRDTAKALTVNANYLSTLFHKDTGMTFIDFVNRERTNQAAALLRHTNLQIQQIASTVGYNNTSYFAKQFVRFQGISPSHYRREI